MAEHDHQTTPEQDAEIENLVDSGKMSYYLARAAVLGIKLEQPEAQPETAQDVTAGTKESPSTQKSRKRRYHPVSKVPDADSAHDPNWNVKRPKLTDDELAEQDAINAFGRAMVDNELAAAAAARSKAAEVPKEATAEELQARHDAVKADWDKIQEAIDDDLIAHPEKDPIFDPTPDRRFFDPYNRKPTRD